MAIDENQNIASLLHELAPIVLSQFPKRIQREREDIVHDVFVRYWSNVRHRIERIDSPKRYFATAIRREAISRLRKKREVALEGEVLDHANARERVATDKEDALSQISDAVKELPSPDREILLKFYEHQTPIAALANEYEMSYSAMGVRLHRIRQRLRQIISEG